MTNNTDKTAITAAMSSILFRHLRKVVLEEPRGQAASQKDMRQALNSLANSGLVVTSKLMSGLNKLSRPQLESTTRALTTLAYQQLGAHRQHLTLFANFRENTPQDTYRYYLQRVMVSSLGNMSATGPCATQKDEAPFGWGQTPSTTPKVSCLQGMLTAMASATDANGERIFKDIDASHYSAGCPVCHRRIEVPAQNIDEILANQGSSLLAQTQVTMLDLSTDPESDLRNIMTEIATRTTVLNPEALQDLRTIAELYPGAITVELCQNITVRETRATLVGMQLAGTLASDGEERIQKLATSLNLFSTFNTATDILRTLDVAGGGDGSLSGKVKVPRLPRVLRRVLMQFLEGLNPESLAEDVQRHPGAWKRIFERLHVFEWASRGTTFPNVIAAAAAIRGTDPKQVASMGVDLTRRRDLRIKAGMREQVRHHGIAARIEEALQNGKALDATRILASRPGELGRRLSQLLQGADQQEASQIADMAQKAMGKMTARMLLQLQATLRGRQRGDVDQRIVRPKAGGVFLLKGQRGSLPSTQVQQLRAEALKQLTSRLEGPLSSNVAVVNEELRTLILPHGQRNASRSLVTLGRGSQISHATDKNRTVRLFVHWMEGTTGRRLDLDLSALMFDKDWKLVDQVTFYCLRGSGAVHSGDLTSAPAPLGSTEYIDLDLNTMYQKNVSHVVMMVNSFNGVAFEDMGEAYAGFMLRSDLLQEEEQGSYYRRKARQDFDSRSVEQRYDLTGKQQVSMPLALSLSRNGQVTMTWLDSQTNAKTLNGSIAQDHSVEGAALARATIQEGEHQVRPTLWDVALVQAGKGNEVITQNGNKFIRFTRHPGESDADFISRIDQSIGGTPTQMPLTAVEHYCALRTTPLPSGSTAVALRQVAGSEEGVTTLSWEELTTRLG